MTLSVLLSLIDSWKKSSSDTPDPKNRPLTSRSFWCAPSLHRLKSQNVSRTSRISSLHRWELQVNLSLRAVRRSASSLHPCKLDFRPQKSNVNWMISPAGTIHHRYLCIQSASSSPMRKSVWSRYVNAVAHHSDRVSDNVYCAWQVVHSGKSEGAWI